MMNILFVYKKKDRMMFVAADKARKHHERWLKLGFEHISTINPEMYLGTIWDIVSMTKLTDSQKVIEIKNLLESK